MAKRQKNRNSPAQKRQHPALTIEAQEKRTHALLAEKKYKEASESCKKLLKQDNRAEWIDLLAEIYSLRAQELVAKGMYKEAIMIWRNRSELCGTPLIEAFYCRTLLEAAMTEKILALYLYDTAKLEQTGCLEAFREHLAALSLGSPGEILKHLPAEDILIKDHPIALGALEAYCAGNDDLLHDRLKTISFRSPFRDLKLILKALSLPENDTSSAKLLSRIASASPFARLAEAITLSDEPDIRLFSNMSELTPEIAQFVMLKKGFDSQLLNFHEELRKLGDSPTPDALVRFISRHHKTIGTKPARQLALRLLVMLPSGNSVFTESFNKATPLETAQIEALRIELQKRSCMDAIRAWENVESILNPNNPELLEGGKLSFALIGRRKLEHIGDLDHDGELDDAINRQLEWVILNDPKDHTCYLRLIANYRKQRKLKEARASLEKAMANFPDDIAILTEAVETSLASKAYKKAAVYGKQILKKDPINIQVRAALIEAHLSHARKLMDKQKYSLAEKELDIAGSWGKTSEDKGRVELVRGTLLLDQKQLPKATTTWRAATEMLGGGLSGHLYLLLEILRQNRSVAAILKKTGIKLTTKPQTEKQLLTFFLLLENFKKNKRIKHIAQALKLLKSPLEKAAKLKFSPPDFEMICETLSDFNTPKMSLLYAKEARKRWPEESMFIYHVIAAETEIDGYLYENNFDRLEVLIANAEEHGEKKLKHRAIALIKTSQMPPPDFDSDFDMAIPPDMDTLVEMMISTMPRDLVIQMKKEMGAKAFEVSIRAMIMSEMDPDMLGMLEDDDDDDDFNPFAPKPKKKKTPNPRQRETF